MITSQGSHMQLMMEMYSTYTELRLNASTPHAIPEVISCTTVRVQKKRRLIMK